MIQHINTCKLREIISMCPPTKLFRQKFQAALNLQSLNIKYVSSEDLLSLAGRINKREMKNDQTEARMMEGLQNFDLKSEKHRIYWKFGQLKIFGWAVMAISIIKEVKISQFKQEYIYSLKDIFTLKNIDFIQFQLKTLLYSNFDKTAKWQQQQIDLLKSILLTQLKQHQNWKEISYLLFAKSNYRYYRTIHKCKEKWMNCLNPDIEKGDWTLSEDLHLFEMVKLIGPKWAAIAKDMKMNRTEHMIKNRYNRYQRKWTKRGSDNNFVTATCLALKRQLMQQKQKGIVQSQQVQDQKQQTQQLIQPISIKLTEQKQIQIIDKIKTEEIPVQKQSQVSICKQIAGLQKLHNYDQIGEQFDLCGKSRKIIQEQSKQPNAMPQQTSLECYKQITVFYPYEYYLSQSFPCFYYPTHFM